MIGLTTGCHIRCTIGSNDFPRGSSITRFNKHLTALCLGGLLGLSSLAANAADLPLKAAPYAAPVAAGYNWTGFYIGANLGAGWGTREAGTLTFSSGNEFATSGYNISGFMGGGQVGYNWQLAGMPVVLGVEGTFDWADIKGSATDCLFS